eukprot:403339436
MKQNKQAIYTLALVSVLLASIISAHEIIPQELLQQVEQTNQQGKVGGILPQLGHGWHSWFFDQISLNVWLLTSFFIWPVGLICNLIGKPQIYQYVYNSIVSGAFSLSLYYAPPQ